MSKKTLLFIAAVAVMLAGATSASAYYEMWDGWFNPKGDSGSVNTFMSSRGCEAPVAIS